MDHVIVTNFEGDVCIYRGPSLPELIREVTDRELDYDPEESPAAILELWANPDLTTLRTILGDQDVDCHYSGPEAV